MYCDKSITVLYHIMHILPRKYFFQKHIDILNRSFSNFSEILKTIFTVNYKRCVCILNMQCALELVFAGTI